jgi:hypothetical protein
MKHLPIRIKQTRRMAALRATIILLAKRSFVGQNDRL